VSPNTAFPLNESPQNAITERVLEHPRVTFDVGQDVLVLAMKEELLVRASVRSTAPVLGKELQTIARNCGSLGSRSEAGLTDEVEIWRLIDPEGNSIDQARRLRGLVRDQGVQTKKGPTVLPPAVSPNHVCVVSRPFDTCPDGPPHPTPPPSSSRRENFIELPRRGPVANVVVIDTGYIRTDPQHKRLDQRVSTVPGQWPDTSTAPMTWREDPPDTLDADDDGRLDGVAGHGTFVAGVIAHHCRQAHITIVGQRHECMPVTDPPTPVDQAMLFTSEFALAHSLLQHCDADVVSCGFAFPTLDDFPSIPFTSVMQELTAPNAPRPGVAVVAPAGNERSARPYWPAAHPDVIGVASTNRRGKARAQHSNWGPWADCCTRGQDVLSTFVIWDGPIEGEPLGDAEDFCGWARWNGTSFAAPKVSAAIARLVAESAGGQLLPVDAFHDLLGGRGGVQVTQLTDSTLSPLPGVTLPHLHLG
jgi:hypothetical protein